MDFMIINILFVVRGLGECFGKFFLCLWEYFCECGRMNLGYWISIV